MRKLTRELDDINLTVVRGGSRRNTVKTVLIDADVDCDRAFIRRQIRKASRARRQCLKELYDSDSDSSSSSSDSSSGSDDKKKKKKSSNGNEDGKKKKNSTKGSEEKLTNLSSSSGDRRYLKRSKSTEEEEEGSKSRKGEQVRSDSNTFPSHARTYASLHLQ